MSDETNTKKDNEIELDWNLYHDMDHRSYTDIENIKALESKVSKLTNELSQVNPYTGCKCRYYEDLRSKLIEEKCENLAEILRLFADPESMFWVDHIKKVSGQKVYIMKSNIQLSKTAKDILRKCRLQGPRNPSKN